MKAKSIWRRELAFVLTVVILVSCWVFVAPNIKATYSGTAGKYYVKVTIDSSNATGGWNSNHHMTINGKNMNGTGSEAQIAYVDHTVNYNGTKTVWEGETDKFPTYAGYRYNFGGGATNRNLRMKIHIYVGSSSSSLSEVAAHGSDQHGDSGYFSAADGTISLSVGTDKYPKASTASGLSIGNQTIDSDSDNFTATGPTSVKDQYGVQIDKSKVTDQTFSISAYKATNASGSDLTKDVQIDSSGKVTAVDGKYYARGYDNHYLQIKYSGKFNGGTATTNAACTLSYKPLTATWKYYTDNSGAATGSSNTATSTVYFGDTPTARTDLTKAYYDNAQHHSGGTFSTSRMTANKTFTMAYSTNTNHTMNQYSQIANDKVNHSVKCSGCAYTQTVEHNYGSWSDNGNGTCSRTCSKCNFKQTESHDWGTWQIIPNPDTDNNHTGHEQAAEHYRVCKHCQKAKDYDNHTWSFDKKIAATCLSDGHTQYKCDQCQLTRLDLNQDGDDEEDLVPALGHDHQYYADGTKTDTTHQEKCSRCGDIIDVDHPSYGDWYEIDGTQHAHKCTVCQHEVKENHPESKWSGWQHAVPPADATGVRAIVREKLNDASYDATKQCFNYCNDCGYVKYQNHKWDDGVTTPAKCEEEGKTVYTCNDCENTKEEKIAATGHTWVRWEGCDESQISELNSSVPVVFKCQNGCGKYCASYYDDNEQKYVADTLHTGTSPTSDEIIGNSDSIPTPMFNEYEEPFDPQNPYVYAERKASLRVRLSEQGDPTQAMRFSGHLKATNLLDKVDFNADPNLLFNGSALKSLEEIRANKDAYEDNKIIDFGFVFTQARFIRTAKTVIDYDLMTLDNIGTDYRIYRMSVVGNNLDNYNQDKSMDNWKGLTMLNYDEDLTFNLVIDVNEKNYQATYCARTYIIYKYRGDIIVLYDQPGINYEDETHPYYSHDSVYNQANKVLTLTEPTDLVKRYLENKIINNTVTQNFNDSKGDKKVDYTLKNPPKQEEY